MRVPTSETVIVKPELIRLVRRLDSKKWQAHYKLEKVKTWFRRSGQPSAAWRGTDRRLFTRSAKR